MIAPPWLTIPPQGYGGIENVIFALVPELLKLGVKVELFTTGDSKLRSTKKHWLYPEGQYAHIHEPYYDSSSIPIAHVLFALNKIKADGQFDIIHDHNNFIGPTALSRNDKELPPAIHTLHNPQFIEYKDRRAATANSQMMWKELAKSKKLHLVGVSEAVTKSAPRALKSILLPYVHNAVNYDSYPFVTKKSDYFMTLARFHPEKGQALAVNVCLRLGYRLKMAGMVNNLSDPKKVLLELANPLSTYRSLIDFRYYSDYIFPHLSRGKIESVGEVKGKQK